jgi:3'-phosphoadenosine 5'-phosphosulfate sulfotransferase (PAPS reductase)/FAD synthetase
MMVADLTSRIDAAEDILGKVFGSGQPVFLAFSGGKDSLTVLKLCEPWRGRFKLLWVNTGYAFPHMEKMIRSYGEEYGLIELHSDPRQVWAAGGLPSEVLSVSSFMKRDGDRLQPWNMCCHATTSAAMFRFCAAFDGFLTILVGDRRQDGWRFQGPAAPKNVAFIAPIREWSDVDVFGYLETEGVTLPEHYAEVKDGLDCWNCPASWMGASGDPVAYARWMKATYPELAAQALPIARRVANQIDRATTPLREALSC